MLCRSLYGQCIFSQKVKANTDLADEFLAATKSPQFAANAVQLQASFNASVLAYETQYWATTTAGARLSLQAMHLLYIEGIMLLSPCLNCTR